MNRKAVLFAVAAVLLTSASAVWAMGGVYGKGDPSRPISVSGWPAGITILANRTDRVSGSWVNASDSFNYQGNVRTFNAFLADYAKVPGITPMLTLQNGDGTTVLLPSKDPITVQYDWQMNTGGWGRFTSDVRLPLNGKIALKEVKVPANVSVGFLGPDTPSPEVKRFLAKHAKPQ